jgi:hypothetical protein
MLVSGETPLFFAILGQGSRAIVQYLINSGADPNKANNRGITPLHLAAGQGFFCPCYVCFGVLAVSLSFFFRFILANLYCFDTVGCFIYLFRLYYKCLFHVLELNISPPKQDT